MKKKERKKEGKKRAKKNRREGGKSYCFFAFHCCFGVCDNACVQAHVSSLIYP